MYTSSLAYMYSEFDQRQYHLWFDKTSQKKKRCLIGLGLFKLDKALNPRYSIVFYTTASRVHWIYILLLPKGQHTVT